MDYYRGLDADVLCLQETKMQPEDSPEDFSLGGKYHVYFNSAQKKGYAGTALFSKIKPISIAYGMDIAQFDTEGRIICAEYESYYFVNVYTPNAQRELTRLTYRCEWEDAFRSFLHTLDETKPVVVCGDMNVAHNEIDIARPKQNRGNAGFTDEERAKMTELLAAGFTDSYRHLYPDKTGAYSWWSYMKGAKENNVGWRIDYFLVSDRLAPDIAEAHIYPDVSFSDHCPVGVELS
jgi:exodeoxyribonuclease-3